MKNAIDTIWQNIFSIYRHLFIFVPLFVFVGIILIYNNIPYIPYVIGVLLIVSLRFFNKSDRHKIITYILAFVALGAVAMGIRNYTKPQLQNLKQGMYNFTGTVKKFSLGIEKNKIILSNLKNYQGKVQLNTTKQFNAGDVVKIRAFVLPPSKPVIRGAFDFSKYARYKEIIGFGRVLDVKIISTSSNPKFANEIVSFVYKNTNARVASVAAALITGNRIGIPNDDLNNLRSSGLAHLLAISGLHIGLVMGVVYFILRILLVSTLFNRSTLLPIKKFCGVCALTVAFLYAGLADYPIPTLRAFTMALIVIFGLLIDRQVINIRSVAMVATALALIVPEAIFSPAYQLSFIAVFALVGMFQVYEGKVKGIKGFVVGVVFSSLIVQIVTAPFIIYHFGLFSVYSVVANVFAIPLMTFFIAPALLLAVFEMVIFNTSLFLSVSSFGLEILLKWAEIITNMDYSKLNLQNFSVFAVIFFTLAIVMFIMGKLENKRFLFKFSFVFTVFGIIIFALPNKKPLIYVLPNKVIIKQGDVYQSNRKINAFIKGAIYRQTGMNVVYKKLCNNKYLCKIDDVIIANVPKYACKENAKLIIALKSTIKSCKFPSIDKIDMLASPTGYEIDNNYKITPNY